MSQVAQRVQQKIRQLQAERDMFQRTCEQLSEAVTAKDHELAEVRLQLRDIKKQMQELLHAIQHSSEQHQAMLRRQFGASSERTLCDQYYLHDVIAQLDPELAQMLHDVEETISVAAQEIETTEDTGTAESSQECSQQSSVTNGLTGAPEQATTAVAPDKATQEATVTEAASESNHRRPPESGGRKPLSEDLPRQYRLYQPHDGHPIIAQAEQVTVLTRKIIERLDIRPVEPYVAQYDCAVCRITLPGGIVTQETIAPPAILPKGQVSDHFIVHSVVAKVLDHLPNYRQTQQLARYDLEIHRSKMARWHISAADFLAPVAEAVLYETMQEPVIGIDDTVHRLLDVELHRCRHGRLWAIQGTINSYYFFSETREGKWIEQALTNYHGAIMGDAYSGHQALLRHHDIIPLFCWAHVRRKFYDANKCLKRDQALAIIKALYRIEQECADQPPDQRVAHRSRLAGPILAQFKELLDAWQADSTVLAKSGIGRATTYALNQWHGLTAYLTIGEAPIDNNHTERAMRPNALHRKNSLFSASKKGAASYAILSTLIHSACNHGLNPQVYLNDIIDDIHHRRRPIKELTPAAYAKRIATGSEAVTPVG